MLSFLQSKTMAKTLRLALAERDIRLSHSECLELTARQFGFSNWNMLSARIDATTARNHDLQLPEGWLVTGHTRSEDFRIGLDPEEPGAALVECRHDRTKNADWEPSGIGCLMQSALAEAFRGQKIRLSASLKTIGADLGTIWLRIDKATGEVLRFDNMMERDNNGPLKGSAGWTERSIVLDVPDDAESLHYGFFLKGFGRVWARNLKLDITDPGEPTTDLPRPTYRPKNLVQPTNLDFSRRSRKVFGPIRS